MDLLVLVITFVAVVAPFLLGWLVHNLLSERRASAQRNEEDLNPGTRSPPISQSENDYEVFLSFRGVDTRKGFADHLYMGLVDAGIRAFRDDDELHVGENLSPDRWEAIKNSKILIPIISENYASSAWCLSELVHMMVYKKHPGRKVLPIFYNVEPVDVKCQTGGFGEAFHYSMGRFDQKVVDEWKQALGEVASLRGFHTDHGTEGELVILVVREVLKELKKGAELFVSDVLVGIDGHVEKVMGLVKKSSNAALLVRILGMGGIGKTTLAKVIYNKLSDSFVHRSFIADIRESSNRYGIVYLQNQLISDILGKNNQVCNVDEGIKFITSAFKYKNVLIILDDVDTINQLKALAGNPNWFASESRIIVTTRNKSVLDWAGVYHDYELGEMDEDQSLILFSRHAFRRDSPPNEFFDRSRLVVSITGGLPLAIEVVGSLLCGQPSPIWRKTIQKMQNMPHKAVQEKLMVSYDALAPDEQEMFLDIACFLIGSDARVAYYMWDACGFFASKGIEVLVSLSFINIGDNHEFRMHNLLRALGREIVHAENSRKPHKRSRLWDYEDALEVLEGKKGTQMIQAIYLEGGYSTRTADEDDSDYIYDQGSRTLSTQQKKGSHIFTDEQFRNLSSLRFLHMSDVNLAGDFSNLFSELRWLKWANCPSKCEATNLHSEKLVILDLSGSPISDDWQGWRSMMRAEKLKVLNLTGCHSLKRTSYLSAFKRLEILIFRDCSELERIDSRIGDMENLFSLDLSGCSRLKELPFQMAKLEQLKELLLDETAIKEIPPFISSLKKLETLSANNRKVSQ